MTRDLVDPFRDYVVLVRRTRDTQAWTYEIRRRSKPQGISIFHEGYPSEYEAKLAGEKLLTRLLMAA